MYRFLSIPLALLLALLGGCRSLGGGQSPYGIIDPPGISVEREAETVLFAVIGDYGSAGEDEEAVADLVKGWDPDFILTTGDNNYRYGEYATLYQNIGQYYGDYIYNFDAPEEYRCNGKAFTEAINRFFPCPGNHDALGPNELEPYLNYFSLPGAEQFYAFSWGEVAFYSINSLSLADHEVQKAWLAGAIEQSDKAFQVVYFHHPPYSPGPHGGSDRMQWDFYRWGVDVVLSGHDHVYARMEHQDQEGLHYLVNGVGGRSLYSCDQEYAQSGVALLSCHDSQFGAMRCFADSSQLIMEFYSIDDPSQPVDRLVIRRECP